MKIFLYKDSPKKIFLLITLLIFFCYSAHSQNNKKEKLENEKRKLEKEIAYTNELLLATKKDKAATITRLLLLKSKIDKQQALMNNINTEIALLGNQINSNQTQINKLSEELRVLKEEYAKMIYYASKNRNANERLMFIFASDDFDQALRRLRYLQEYGKYRQRQAENIVATKYKLNNTIDLLDKQKNEKLGLLISQQKEKKILDNERQTKSQMVDELKRKEKSLISNVREKEQKARKIQNQIATIIAEEIRRTKIKTTNPSTGIETVSMTPEDVELSSSFADNKGKLPWPLDRGEITSRFGEHPHPLFPEVIIKNNGVDIVTTKNAVAKAVFKGTVSWVLESSNTFAVLIKHGEYFSFYANLAEVYVKKGENVKTKQNIGLVKTDPIEGKTELHFELWRNIIKLDPTGWITAKN